MNMVEFNTVDMDKYYLLLLSSTTILGWCISAGLISIKITETQD